MEGTLGKSGHGGEIKEEKISPSNCDEEDDSKDQMLIKDNQLELARAEMAEVRQENQRLKMCLDQMMDNYKALQNQFHNIVHENKHQELAEESVSLSLGRSSSSELKIRDDDHRKEKIPNTVEALNIEKDKQGGLVLGLDCKFDANSEPNKSGQDQSSGNPSPDNSLEEMKEDGGETLASQKNLKTMRSARDDEVSQQNPPKRVRVSVRVRCDTPTMNDGCQWRKYGQKIAKGNPCPRAYYRCTVAPSCPVRKQVQRCSDDISILITTYEGTHNHPLPLSATAMASSTSAAAGMLLSGSSTSSGSGATNPSGATAAELHGINYYISNNNNSKSKIPPFNYLPNSSISSPSPSCPTITLDLTNSTSNSHFNRMNFQPRNNCSTNLNFSSLESSSLPTSWSYGNNYTQIPSYNKNQIGSLNFGSSKHQDNLYQSYMQKSNSGAPSQQSVHLDSIEAATKAITSDPSFQSALAAAITSIMGSNNGGPNVKLEQTFPVMSSFPSSSPQPSNLRFVSPPPLPFSSSKSKSTSPEDNRDHGR